MGAIKSTSFKETIKQIIVNNETTCDKIIILYMDFLS